MPPRRDTTPAPARGASSQHRLVQTAIARAADVVQVVLVTRQRAAALRELRIAPQLGHGPNGLGVRIAVEARQQYADAVLLDLHVESADLRGRDDGQSRREVLREL